MVKPYQRIVSLVCIACETCECERCNVEDLAKRIIDDVRSDAIDDFVERITLPLTEEDIERIVIELKEQQ